MSIIVVAITEETLPGRHRCIALGRSRNKRRLGRKRKGANTKTTTETITKTANIQHNERGLNKSNSDNCTHIHT